jgi:glycerol-3-phosphate O-acyltransferase
MQMPTMTTAETTYRSRAPWWFNIAGHLLEPWVRIRRDPAEPAALLKGDAPVCYVIERDGFSDGLILDRACREAGLPSPMQPLAHTRRRRSVFALARRDGEVFGRNRKRSPNEPIGQLIRSLEGFPDRDTVISITISTCPTRPRI